MTWKHIRTRLRPEELLPPLVATLRADLRSGNARGWPGDRANRDESGHGRRARARGSQNNPCSADTFCIHIGLLLRHAPLLIVKKREKESADKPGSVEDNHSSAIRVAAYLQRPTREPVWATRAAPSEDGTACSPIWSCSRRGLPCHRVLPPARCALTAPFHPYRPLCRGVGGLLSVALSVGSRPPGVTWRLALGARTFLHACAQRLPGRLRPRWWGRCRREKARGNSAPQHHVGRRCCAAEFHPFFGSPSTVVQLAALARR